MKKISVKTARTPWLDKLLVVIAFLLTAAAIVTGSYVHDRETVAVGEVSPKRYVADRDEEDTAATEALRQEARDSVGTLYKQDESVRTTVLSNILDFFETMDQLLSSMAEDETKTYGDAVFAIPAAPSETQFAAYESLSEQGRQNYHDDVADVANKVLDQGITQDTLVKSFTLAQEYVDALNWNQDMKNLAMAVLEATLSPNLVVDQDAMDALAQQRADQVEPVMILKGQKLVDQGEIVTQTVYNILVELNMVEVDYTSNLAPFFGSLVLVVLLFMGAILYFRGSRRKLRANEVWILFTAYVVVIAIVRVLATRESYAYLPVTLFAMLVAVLLDSRRAAVLSAMETIACLFIFNGDLGFLLYFLISGTLTALLMPYTEKRNRIFLVALGIGGVDFLSYLSIGMFTQGGMSDGLPLAAGIAALTGVLSLMVAVGSLPFWEAVFEANTPMRLLELVNPNNSLLRRLMLEAPGTYHHSLIVANLAETAAYEIGANTTVARVGAYYHDIGKLKNPLYFAENQTGENPHDALSPSISARMLKDHVTYGRELAIENRLPRPVIDIVVQHHGTSLIKYFYMEACKERGPENVNEADYRYPGPIPQNRESALVMLADTVEAAVRANVAAGKDQCQIGALIGMLIKDKLDDGQLDQSGLAIADLETAKLAFLQVFTGMYHDRVQYPAEEQIRAMQEEGQKNDDVAHG